MRFKFLGKYRGRRGDDGGTVVEFAVVAVVFLSLVIGTLETSLAFYSYHVISEVARDGSRYAMVHGNTCAVGASSCTVTAAQVKSFVQSESYPGVVGTNLAVSVNYSGYPAGTACSPNLNCENPGNLVTVKVVYPFFLGIPFVRSSQLSITSTSAMVIAQ